MGSRILPSIPYLPPIISPLLYPSDVILPFPFPQWDAISEGLPGEMGGIFCCGSCVMSEFPVLRIFAGPETSLLPHYKGDNSCSDSAHSPNSYYPQIDIIERMRKRENILYLR